MFIAWEIITLAERTAAIVSHFRRLLRLRAAMLLAKYLRTPYQDTRDSQTV